VLLRAAGLEGIFRDQSEEIAMVYGLVDESSSRGGCKRSDVGLKESIIVGYLRWEDREERDENG